MFRLCSRGDDNRNDLARFADWPVIEQFIQDIKDGLIDELEALFTSHAAKLESDLNFLKAVSI